MTVGIYSLYWEQEELIYIGQSVNIEERFKTHISNCQKLKHSNNKVQHTYNLFGLPQLVILEVCEIESLNLKEEFWQNEFNSLSSLDIVPAGLRRCEGLYNPRNKYSKIQLILTFRYCRNPCLTSKNISSLTGVSLSIVDDIRSGRVHEWLQEKYPFSWKIINNTRRVRVKNGYEHSKKKLGRSYIFISPSGEEYKVDNFTKFGKEHKLDSSDLSRVASGKYTHTKGWRIKT